MELSLELLNDFSIGVGGYSTTLGSKSYVALTTVTSSRIAYPGVTGAISITSGTGEYRINGGSWVSAQPELVTNGIFDTDTTGWTPNDATLTIDTQRLLVTADTGIPQGGASQVITVVAGNTYSVSIDVIPGTSNGKIVFSGAATVSDSNLTLATHTYTFVAASTSLNVFLYVQDLNIAETCLFDNVSVQRILATTDYIEARMTSSGSYSTALELVFALDTGTDTFTVTTEASAAEALTAGAEALTAGTEPLTAGA